MLSVHTIATVKSTIPLLESAGVAITDHFYQRMFRLNPELKNIFNMANQANGRQQFALFNAIAAYAKNIDNLGVLGEIVERVAQKHTSFFIQPEHYDIVGHHLIETLRELAPEDFTPDVEQAWSEAYGALAEVFINREGDLYRQTEKAQGGWLGARQFKVLSKTPESSLVTSFVLSPVDGKPVVGYKPGQYLGIKVQPRHCEYAQMRQYSLSDKPNSETYRISVKRELGEVNGLVSNHLHESVAQGDVIDVLPPAGDFFQQNLHLPTVLISAGVGLTPMMSMLEATIDSHPSTAIHFLHACENPQQHSFIKRVSELEKNTQQLATHTWYAHQAPQADNISSGLMSLSPLANKLPLRCGNFYICGPAGFMKFIKEQLIDLGVKEAQIHYEVFGPHSDL
ncbi:NO-inducible flavohemoprotein [Paraglaciecola chathamensis]|uniref:Flavohemoprotein n=1 Tax=Paraglaciecola chathamensis TaxID=368405 RepID=A0ABS0WGC0_9ALTE|nr:NO-inducible flavohemoprotein [Paraglaciecola chathamensis]MBJ2137525.1 NO-inducible flavohemoprotein [Paraglaciecola chathamensis]